MTIEVRERYRGSLLGLAVGDAIGATLEGERARIIYTA
jgi:ADP-ribosylglycohydrolase